MKMCHHGKFFIRVVVTAFALVLMWTGCKDPNDFKPDYDWTTPPPPPVLSYPINDTILWIGNDYPDSMGAHTFIDWNEIEGAEQYEVHVDTNIAFNSPELQRRLKDEPPTYVGMRYFPTLPTYYVRVRAGCWSWEYFTDWSEPRRFYIYRDSL